MSPWFWIAIALLLMIALRLSPVWRYCCDTVDGLIEGLFGFGGYDTDQRTHAQSESVPTLPCGQPHSPRCTAHGHQK